MTRAAECSATRVAAFAAKTPTLTSHRRTLPHAGTNATILKSDPGPTPAVLLPQTTAIV